MRKHRNDIIGTKSTNLHKHEKAKDFVLYEYLHSCRVAWVEENIVSIQGREPSAGMEV